MIPIKFTLGGTEYRVKIEDSSIDNAVVAQVSYPEALVSISSRSKGKQCTDDYMEASFYHELVHAMLETMGKRNLSEDEELVEWLANQLHQFMKTAEYNK